MINFVLGIAIGAAFSPVWLSLWDAAKKKYEELFSKDKQ